MRLTKRAVLKWISIAGIIFFSMLLVYTREAECTFGEDIPFLIQIIAQAIQQVQELQSIIGSAQQTASVLEEMNRGVKDVLQLADTAHVPLPPQVYDNAKQIDLATQTAESLYGGISGHSPAYARNQYKSGVEGLFLSQDAFQYSSFLDDKGRSVKDAAVVSNQATATRLTAETLGVLLHAVSHENRLQAKQLEIQSTNRIEDAAKEDSRLQSFTDTHQSIESDMRNADFSSLNSFGSDP
jgi:hypothetical protein